MKLYHAKNTRSVRIIWLLEELGLDYELQTFTLGDKAMREPDYLAVNPMGRVPTLEDGNVTLHESGAITQYVIEKYGKGRLIPEPTSADYPRYLQWMHYAEGMLMPPVNTIVVEKFFLPAERRNDENVRRATKLLTRMVASIEPELAGRDYLAGAFSGADIMTGHALMAAVRIGEISIDDLPNIAAYIARLEERPELQKARTL